ncbi:hypothetical protein KEM56_007673 [Ascosphaera pollenicola]|nr:hypothetical protein KEM56_007673 [Ascosphaera pollenicola]
MAFDQCKTRPSHIHAILNGLDRYNPETTTVFQDYVTEQCQDKTFDCYANLALLKLYQFNPHLLDTQITTHILAKALTVFPSPAFSLSLALLPPYTTPHNPGSPTSSNEFVDAVQKLTTLSTLLESAQYAKFWETYKGADHQIYAEVTADIADFEELIRVQIAAQTGRAFRVIGADVLGSMLDISDAAALEKFVTDVCAWSVDKSGENPVVQIPPNKENEARGEVKSEKVGIEQFGRIIRRGFEQPV